MKAITCTQCGALVKKISLKEKFAHCDYCGAKILLSENEDKIVEIPDKEEKKLSPWEQHQENYRKMRERVRQYNPPGTTYDQPPQHSSVAVSIIVFLGIGLVVVVGFVFLIVGLFSSPGRFGNKTSLKSTPVPTAQSPSPTPLPKIKYDAKVEWDGMYLNYDMEHFEYPKIDVTKLPTFNEQELKKTVFKVRNVQVKITINTNGEVTSAEPLSGHPVLQEAAVKAAKKSLFEPRQKPTTRTLTYFFRLITE